MKFKEIKPGMVIHCPKEEDARALLEHLDSLGYKDNNTIMSPKINPSRYCRIIDDWGYQWYCEVSNDITITEFSDLIEPEPDIEFEVKDCGDAITSTIKEHGKITSELSEPKKMSEVEILEWLNDYVRDENSEKLSEVFDVTTLEAVFCIFNVDEIVDKITAYEAAKKKKPIELEWVKVVRIIQKEHDAKRCVYEEELPTNAKKIPTEGILRKYMAEHEGNYFAVVVSRCRVKESEQDG